MSQDTPQLVEQVRERAIELGAVHAQQIEPSEVPTAQWVRLKCQYGCGGYGRRLTCPPYSPTPEVTRQMLDEYELALLLHSVGKQTELRELAVGLEREAFLAGFHKAFAMGAGPCHRCQQCDPDAGCSQPGAARPAMEACGIDVFETARRAGLPIDVVRERDDTPNHYALLLLY